MKLKTLIFNDKAVKSEVLKGQPWCKGHDVASIFGYARPGKAIIDHVPGFLKTKI